MMASKALMKKLQQDLKEHPLQFGEFRRIKGMGSHFVSMSPTHDGATHLFSVELEGKTVFVYKN